MPDRSSRYLLDNTVFIAAVKRKWTKSTELIYHLLDSPAELFANELLIFEYEKYARALDTHELLNYMKKSMIRSIPRKKRSMPVRHSFRKVSCRISSMRQLAFMEMQF